MHHIWYHAKCTDGLGAAYAVWSALGDSGCKYTPVAYGDPLPPIEPDDEVTMVDFSAPRADLLRLAQIASRITILDHHASAERGLEGLDTEALATEGACEIRVTFDMEHSGAVLAWQHFHPGTHVPLPLTLIEDRDLWRFAHSGSRALHYAICDLGDFRVLDELFESNKALLHYIQRGQFILDHLTNQWLDLADRAAEQRIMLPIGADGAQGPGYFRAGIPCVICACPPAWFSDLGALLLEQHPAADIAVLYADHQGRQQITVSLRSRPGGPDVSRIAAHYGGGGHPRAAGYRVPLRLRCEGGLL
jgi:hypothetical protein